MKNKRPVRRKRRSFEFKRGFVTMVVYDLKTHRAIRKTIEAQILGHWAFHTYFKNQWIVVHAPTGIPVMSFDNRKEAVILIKRLCTKVKSTWYPTKEILENFIEWHHETLELIRQYYETITKCADYQDITNTKEDIPF